ncbi:MAG: hypothetical protein NZT61_02475 [Deltaproteobacteria bacterium]|nr:hypothetical protein [Deltaproteobacteria bacterium]
MIYLSPRTARGGDSKIKLTEAIDDILSTYFPLPESVRELRPEEFTKVVICTRELGMGMASLKALRGKVKKREAYQMIALQVLPDSESFKEFLDVLIGDLRPWSKNFTLNVEMLKKIFQYAFGEEVASILIQEYKSAFEDTERTLGVLESLKNTSSSTVRLKEEKDKIFARLYDIFLITKFSEFWHRKKVHEHTKKLVKAFFWTI